MDHLPPFWIKSTGISLGQPPAYLCGQSAQFWTVLSCADRRRFKIPAFCAAKRHIVQTLHNIIFDDASVGRWPKNSQIYPAVRMLCNHPANSTCVAMLIPRRVPARTMRVHDHRLNLRSQDARQPILRAPRDITGPTGTDLLGVI